MLQWLKAILSQYRNSNTEGTPIFLGIGSRSLSIQTGTITKLLVAGLVVTVGVVTASFAFVAFGPGSASAMSVALTAENVSLTTDDGKVEAVTIDPTMTVAWNGLDEGAQSVVASYRVSKEPSLRGPPVGDTTVDCTAEPTFDCGNTSQGDLTLSISEDTTGIAVDAYDLTNTREFDASDFSAPEGETVTQTVYVTVEVAVVNTTYPYEAFRSNYIRSKNVTTSFDVTVTNREGELIVTGVLNTGIVTPERTTRTTSTAPPPTPTAEDADGDGYIALADGGMDCDDSDPDTYPGAEELADGKDNDCDGEVDEGVVTTAPP